MDAQTHRALTIEQFTRQAVPFARLPGHNTSLDLLEACLAPGADDVLLDVACGTGIVARHFAPRVRHVVGIDLTPAMLAEAARVPNRRVTWMEGDAGHLPFLDGSFDGVMTRYSFHHFREPAQVLAGMMRVCRPGGRVMVVDVAIADACSAAYDELEKIRDSSHVHALTRTEFAALLAGSGLRSLQFAEYRAELALEAQIAASSPVEGGAEWLRRELTADIGVDRLGIAVRREGGEVRYSVPIGVAVGVRP